jgi:hypothetical protein
MRLYLDIETYRPKKDDVFIDEKIIAIGIIEDWTSYIECSSVNDERKTSTFYFAEWEYGDEMNIICEFYKYLNKLKDSQYKKNRFLEVIGFNILRFDIPLLIQKGFKYGVDGIENLNKLWHGTFVKDYFQICLPLNNMMFKNLKLTLLTDKLKNIGVDIPEPYGLSENIAELYNNNRYDEIIKHLETDLSIIRIVDLNSKKLLKSF